MNEASEISPGRLPEHPKRGTTELPDGGKMIYNGELTVVDKEGNLVSWASSELLALAWEDKLDEEEDEVMLPAEKVEPWSDENGK